MLRIRYMRTGRRNSAFFRVVLTDRKKPTDSGFIKVLGWYNPHTKETSLEKEAILKCLDNGAVPTNSISKLFEKNSIKHKMVKFVKEKEKAPKKKKEGSEKPAAKQEKAEEQTESAESVGEKAEVTTGLPEEPKDEVKSSGGQAEEKEAPLPSGVGVPTENVGKNK